MKNPQAMNNPQVAIIGGGPAGLMAAEVIAGAGFAVSVYDAMPSLGRKFLLAGVGGMNITHSEPLQKFTSRYAEAAPLLSPYLQKFSPSDLCAWIQALGIETFIGSSGRVFPRDMKAAPLLRAWLQRLRSMNVQFYSRHRWIGWNSDGSLRICEVHGDQLVEKNISPSVTVLALGGASWQRLGSDGAWVPLLRERNIGIADLLPSNCGFEISWSERIQQEFAGAPLQTVGLHLETLAGEAIALRGEAMLAKTGIEGTSIYALSAPLRELICARGSACLHLDLLPDIPREKILAQLQKPRGKNSVANFLRKQLHLPPVKLALLRELTPASIWQDAPALAEAIKNLPLRLTGYRPIDEAISSSGGVRFSELTPALMLKNLPGTFCAGEMLDWEAPTGGYLLTGCFATGYAAGLGAVELLQKNYPQ